MTKKELERRNKILEQQLALIHKILMETDNLTDRENVARNIGKIDYYSDITNINFD